MATYQMGPDTYAVPMTLFRDNRIRVSKAVKYAQPSLDDSAYIVLQGGVDIPFNDTDVDHIFRQESFFQYLFGVKEPGCYGAVQVGTGKSVLFVPRLPEEYGVWMGHLHSLEEYKIMYEVDEVKYVEDIVEFFKGVNPSLLLLNCGTNSDSGLQCQGAKFDGVEGFKTNSNILYPVLCECRVIKSPGEIEVLRYVAKVSSDAHKKVMKMVKPGVTEYQAESEFLHHSYSVGGCRHTSYTCICGTGINSSVIHYGHASAPNSREIINGDMCLFDMGANYAGYAADITCSFPANGKFTDKQKLIYNAVLAGRDAVLETAKEGESWVDMHKLANKVMLTKLKEGGIVKGDVDEMIAKGLNGIFQPHGLGHLIGLDVHDVGSYLEGHPKKPVEAGLNNLRFARILKAGMYVSVEPGCYFIDILMDKALADPELSQFLNIPVFESFRNFGGVRIEDDVLITENGCENFAIVPRTVQEIEDYMRV